MTPAPLRPRYIQQHHYNYIQEAYGGRFPVEDNLEKVEAFDTQGSVGCLGVCVQINKNGQLKENCCSATLLIVNGRILYRSHAVGSLKMGAASV